MKKVILQKAAIVILSIVIAFLQTGCTKEKMAQVSIKIDYLGAGGFYNDDIDGVPVGLSLGINGPYSADPERTYTIEYQADENFPVITRQWSPTSGPWTIHCYVQGNTEYITVTPGN